MNNEIVLNTTEGIENLLTDYSQNKNIKGALANAIKFHLKIFNTINNPQNSASIVDYFIRYYEIELDDILNDKEKKNLSIIFAVQVRSFVNLIHAKYLRDGLRREKEADDLIINTINDLVEVVPEIGLAVLEAGVAGGFNIPSISKNLLNNKSILQKVKNTFVNIYKLFKSREIEAEEKEKFIDTLEIIFDKLGDNHEAIAKNHGLRDLVKEYKKEIINYRHNAMVDNHKKVTRNFKKEKNNLFGAKNGDIFALSLIFGIIFGLTYIFSFKIHNFIDNSLAHSTNIFITILDYIALIIAVLSEYAGGIIFIICMIYPAVILIRLIMYIIKLSYFRIKFNLEEKKYLKKLNKHYENIILKFS